MGKSYKISVVEKTNLHINSDLSGACIIRNQQELVYIPRKVLLDIVADYLRDNRIAKLEDQTTAQILELEERDCR